MAKHPNKSIQAALEYAKKHGWEIVPSGRSAHSFCRLRCKQGHTEHQMSIWSTRVTLKTTLNKFYVK